MRQFRFHKLFTFPGRRQVRTGRLGGEEVVAEAEVEERATPGDHLVVVQLTQRLTKQRSAVKPPGDFKASEKKRYKKGTEED